MNVSKMDCILLVVIPFVLNHKLIAIDPSRRAARGLCQEEGKACSSVSPLGRFPLEYNLFGNRREVQHVQILVVVLFGGIEIDDHGELFLAKKRRLDQHGKFGITDWNQLGQFL